MEGILSQEEIDALLGGGFSAEQDEPVAPAKPAFVSKTLKLTREEEDAIGEVGNISLGTSATTLSTLLGKNVSITTPKVEVTNFSELREKSTYGEKVLVEIGYKLGFSGLNLLLIDKKDATIIGDLMMGNDGTMPPDEIDDLYLSAIAEAMNQMMGSAATSLSSLIKQPIDIEPPNVSINNIDEIHERSDFFRKNNEFVTVTFNMEIEGLVKTNIYQVMDIGFVRDITKKLYSGSEMKEEPKKKAPEPVRQESWQQQQQMPPQNMGWQQPQMPPQDMNMGWQQQQQMPPQMGGMNMGWQQPQMPPQMGGMNIGWQQPQMQQQMGMNMGWQQPQMGMNMGWQQPSVNVQPVQFASFGDMSGRALPQNIDLIMDVQLQVTVELGRTKMQIKEILDLGPGSIVELDKLAGEPVDILVNNKLIAKGEVVVIDESFGVRITDIVSQMERLTKAQ